MGTLKVRNVNHDVFHAINVHSDLTHIPASENGLRLQQSSHSPLREMDKRRITQRLTRVGKSN